MKEQKHSVYRGDYSPAIRMTTHLRSLLPDVFISVEDMEQLLLRLSVASLRKGIEKAANRNRICTMKGEELRDLIIRNAEAEYQTRRRYHDAQQAARASQQQAPLTPSLYDRTNVRYEEADNE